jgi:hypothetical protein
MKIQVVWDIISSLRLRRVFVDAQTWKMETGSFSKNILNYLPNDRASYHRRYDSSSTPL